MTRDEAAALKSNMHTTFESPQGKEIMRFIEKIGNWTPTVFDSMDTNDIIARDANRRLIGTLKTIMEISPDQIVTLTEGE
jgi:hypothetical protein